MSFQKRTHFSRPGSNHSGLGRPLPPLPHSRSSSAHFSYHDPALAHSREGSDQFTPGGLHPRPRTETLNPLAKPFVFGGSPTVLKALAPPQAPPAPAAAPVETTPAAPVSAPVAHVRALSLGKPLNVAAPEFKPGGFTFKPPPGVPQLSFSPAEATTARPLPEPPLATSSPVRASQGREKRQRRSSTTSLVDEEEVDEGNDTMASFKFPPSSLIADEVKPMRHSAPASPPTELEAVNNPVNAFTFSGFSSNMAYSETEQIPDNVVAQGPAIGSETQAADLDPGSSRELPFPPASKPKRAPIPLDFKHPVSTNTVPAGLFKALVNGDDERTRRSVRSRLSSRDIFEHSPRPSLDDLTVPTISRRKSRNRLFTDPGFRDHSPDELDVFDAPRRSSLPPRHGHEDSSGSDMSLGPMNLSRRIEMQQYEQRLEVLLDEKIEDIKKTLHEFKHAARSQTLGSSTESMMAEVVSLFRTQLQTSAARELEGSQLDARGDFDFELLKDILEQSQAEARNVMQQDLEQWVSSTRGNNLDFRKFSEDLAERTVKAVLTATSQITMHLHTIEQARPSIMAERDTIVHDILAALGPALSAIRPEPIDYDSLTGQLSQAVKPHISQLIDLASDKRETAGLIVERLVPILPSLYPPMPHIDAEALVGSLSAEMRKIIGPLDAHEMKEQVSDLVVERLDSRLAVRDRALSPEIITEKVTDSIRALLQPLQGLKDTVDIIDQRQQSQPASAPIDLSGIRSEISTALASLHSEFTPVVAALEKAQAEFSAQKNEDSKELADENALQIRDALDQVAEEQKRLISQNTELSDFCQEIVKHIDGLPEAMLEATKVLQNAHADILERDTSKKDAEEIRRLMGSTLR